MSPGLSTGTAMMPTGWWARLVYMCLSFSLKLSSSILLAEFSSLALCISYTDSLPFLLILELRDTVAAVSYAWLILCSSKVCF